MDLNFQVIATSASVALASVVIGYFAARNARNAEAAERKRLNEEITGGAGATQADSIAGMVAKVRNHADVPETGEYNYAAVPSEGMGARPTQLLSVPRDVAFDVAGPLWVDNGAHDRSYSDLLIQCYALGLTQARRAFNISVRFSALGGLVLVLGISLAIFQADTGSHIAGAAITSAAGVLTSGLSQLFRWQSDKTLRLLEKQSADLRKDVRELDKVSAAQTLLPFVDDDDLRDRLRAALILRLSGATIPPLG